MAPPHATKAATALANSDPRGDDHAGQRDGPLGIKTQAQTQATSRWREKYKVHPAADVFPMMSDYELAKLGEDIKANGLKQPISVYYPSGLRGEAVLLDGQNRLEAMERVGLSTDTAKRPVQTGDPVAYIISLNIHRRHLTKQQQADLIMAAAKMTVENKLGQVGPVSERTELPPPSKGGRGKRNPVKEKALAVNAALPEEQQVSERTIKRSLAKAADTTPKPKIRSRAASPSRMGPSTVEGWRRGYINACNIGCPDLDAEQEIIIDALREIASKRAMQRGRI